MEEQTREQIDKYCEKFEKDMLGLFDRSYRKGNPSMMTVRILIPNSPFILILVETALCQGVDGLQWRQFVCSNIREPTYIFHFQINSLHYRYGRLLTTVCCSSSLLLALLLIHRPAAGKSYQIPIPYHPFESPVWLPFILQYEIQWGRKSRLSTLYSPTPQSLFKYFYNAYLLNRYAYGS